MKTTVALMLAGGLITLSMTASAQPGWRHHDHDRYQQRARVIQVEPIIHRERIAIPQTRCYRQPVVTQQRIEGGAIVGGVIGGIIGHNINPREGGATLAGAIVGAAVGQSLSQGHRAYAQQAGYRERCVDQVRYEVRENVVAYRVTYRYRGGIYTTRMRDRPGRFIVVREHDERY